MGLSDEQKMLVAKGINNDGILTAGMADRLYSSKESARSALIKLSSMGFITNSSIPGRFYVIRENREIKDIAENLKKADRKRKEIEENLE